MSRPGSTWIVAMGLIAVTALPAAAFQLRGYVVSSGAADMGVAGMRSLATAGQPAIGRSSQGTQVVWHGYWSAGGTRVLAVDDEGPGDNPALPNALGFGRPSPNPSREAVTFDLALPKDAHVGLEVFDAQGRRIAEVQRGTMGAGYHRVAWSGRDESGQRVSAGVFFARLQVDGRPQGVRRIVLTP